MKKVVVFSGAGLSAESGLSTFRDSGGLWEKYDPYKVATPEAWEENPELVLEFYNARREQVLKAEPNDAHRALAKLEAFFEVKIITQNIDNFHESAGSKSVLHLHGEITKSRSTQDEQLIYEIQGSELNIGDHCERGSQLRPHIVWFGEMVPEMENALNIIKDADILVIVGSSLNVYPAAGLVYAAPTQSEKYLIDPAPVDVGDIQNITVLHEKATIGIPRVVERITKEN